jgi:hypothetical protein
MRCKQTMWTIGLRCELEDGHEGAHYAAGMTFERFDETSETPADGPPDEEEVLQVADEEETTGGDEPVQVALFEGDPVHRLQLALGGGGALAVEKELHNGDEVEVRLLAKVVKVIVHKGEKITTRKHTVKIDPDTVEVDLA